MPNNARKSAELMVSKVAPQLMPKSRSESMHDENNILVAASNEEFKVGG